LELKGIAGPAKGKGIDVLVRRRGETDGEAEERTGRWRKELKRDWIIKCSCSIPLAMDRCELVTFNVDRAAPDDLYCTRRRLRLLAWGIKSMCWRV
jgi:hypothetical protein